MSLYVGSQKVCPIITVGSGISNGVDCLRTISNNNVTTPTTSTTFSTPAGAINVTSAYSFYYMFYRNPYVTTVDCSSVQTVTGARAFYCFLDQNYYNQSLGPTSVNFSNLTTVSGESAFYQAFRSCRKLATINFSNLTTVSGSNAFEAAFEYTYLTTVSFPKLEYIANGAFQRAFYNNSTLQSAYFGGLKGSTIGDVTYPFSSSDTSSYYYMFNNCPNLTEIHFRADAKNKVKNFIGYSSKWGASNATIYFDIDAAIVNFSITPSTGNTIYLGGDLVEGNLSSTDLDDKLGVIYNSNYPMAIRHYSNLQPNQVVTTTVDLTSLSTSNYIELQTGVSGCTAKFIIDGVEYNPTSTSGGNYRLAVNVDSATNIQYSVEKSGEYKKSTGTVSNYNNVTQEITVTMEQASSRTVTLQYPFTTDKSYLEHMIYDSEEEWYGNGYRIGVDENNGYNYEALVDNNLWDKQYSANNFGYITFTTGSETSTLTINANGEYYDGYSGVYISTVSQQQANSQNDFYDPQFGDGGHWMFSIQSSFQAQDFTETLQANTTYYISFNHVIEYNGYDEYSPGFQINKIQFDVGL